MRETVWFFKVDNTNRKRITEYVRKFAPNILIREFKEKAIYLRFKKDGKLNWGGSPHAFEFNCYPAEKEIEPPESLEDFEMLLFVGELVR